ncbi:beta-lactamase domain-containing protein 2-like [Amphiura filiformis]|uniref:beta-lactamase domain-containing protein 2-like n=1 Tax=Amphiura filiformis TaxID=82378 RepID=UPI003B20E2A0
MGFWAKAFVLCVVAVVASLVVRVMQKDKLPIIIDGTVQPGFEEVLEAFRANFESGDVEPREGGSAFAAYYKGKQVVNIWGGYADYESSQPWRHDTMAIVFSVTKGMAALCMAMLVDKGYLDYDQKVVHYWPEFGQNGKENITVRQLLHHEAGLALIDTPITIDLMMNYDELGKALAKSPPIWEPGTTHGYHAFTFGLYASQLLTRADPKKRTLGVYFRDEVAKPFGIEFYIGLPKELNYRVARFFTDGGDLNGVKSFLRSQMDPINRQITWGMVTGQNKVKDVFGNAADASDFYKFNDPRNREFECPSVTGIGTAEALAKVYGIIANGGKTTDGKQFLSEKLIKMIEEGGTPLLEDYAIGIPSRYSYGFRPLHISCTQDREMLGHPGLGGSNAYADSKYRLGVGFVTRYASPYGLGNDPRFTSVRDALYRAIQKDEG